MPLNHRESNFRLQNHQIRAKSVASEGAIGPKSAGACFVDEIGSFGYNSVVIFRV
jgi:hypothetical protein